VTAAPVAKTYGEMTPAERKAALRKIVADQFESEQTAADAKAIQRLQTKLDLKK
jgi:hypothetical protein